jgi:hypothetical protein
LKRDIEAISQVINPESPKCLIVIYDSNLRGNNQKIGLECVLEINELDVSKGTIENKEKMLLKAEAIIYLPEKKLYPRVTCDYLAN